VTVGPISFLPEFATVKALIEERYCMASANLPFVSIGPGVTPMGRPVWFFALFIFLGVVLLAAGAREGYTTYRFVKDSLPAAGVVVENIAEKQMAFSGQGREEQTFYRARVQFRTAAGQEVSILSDSASNPPSYDPGTVVTVLYDPRKPSAASVRDWTFWLLMKSFLFMGLVFSSLGIAGVIKQRQSKNLRIWLSRHGTRIHPQFLRVEQKQRIRVRRDGQICHCL
jgi:hypothetical protein